MINKRESLVLIDGNSLLNVCFYGNLPYEYKNAKSQEEKDKYKDLIQKNSKGEYINGIYTMSIKMLEIFHKINPNYMAIAWDSTVDTFRKKIYSEYKSGRKEKDPLLIPQLKNAPIFFNELGIKNLRIDTFEGDDIIGTIARKSYLENQDLLIYIITKDQDLLQLINDRTFVFLYTQKDKLKTLNYTYKPKKSLNGAFCYNSTRLLNEYNLTPSQIIDFKALVGDKSDNIKGVDGLGEKTIKPLLQGFKDIENIYQFIESHTDEEIKSYGKMIGLKKFPINTFKNGKKDAFDSKKLVSIKKDIPITITLKDLSINIDNNKFKQIFKKYEFNDLY